MEFVLYMDVSDMDGDKWFAGGSLGSDKPNKYGNYDVEARCDDDNNEIR